MLKQTKERRAFEAACKAASNCRAERKQISCFSCTKYVNCSIQERVKRTKDKLTY